MTLKYFFLLAVFFTISGCSNSSGNQECDSNECLKAQAYDNVMAVHDKLMAKISSISEFKGKIEERMNAEEDSLTIAGWHKLMENLDSADSAMWVWMRQFNPELDALTIEEALDYLKEEQDNIDAVARNIDEAIANAEKRLAD